MMFTPRAHRPGNRSPRPLAPRLAHLSGLALGAALCALPLYALPLRALSEDPSPARTTDHPACVPSAATEALLATIDLSLDAGCFEDLDCYRSKLETARRLVVEHPSDLHLHRLFQELVLRYYGDDASELLAKIRSFYSKKATEHPDDAMWLYLDGRLLGGQEQVERFRRSVAADPGLPWGHFGLAVALGRDDRPAALAEAQRFLDLCPTRETALSLTLGLDDADLWRPHLAVWRETLRHAPLRRQLHGFPLLWSAGFRFVPPPEHPAVRARVAADLEVLRAADRPDLSSWWEALGQGYEALGDPQALARFEAEVVEADPCSRRAVDARMRPFEKRAGNGPDSHSSHSPKELWEQTGRWLEQCPDEFQYSALHYSVVGQLEDLPDDRLVAEVERHLAVWEKVRHRYRMMTTPWGSAAELLLDRGLAPQRAVELAELEAGRTRKETRGATLPDPSADRSEIGGFHGACIRRSDHFALLARARFASGDTEGARAAVGEAESALSDLLAVETAFPDRLSSLVYDTYRGRLDAVLAEQARREDRTADAFALYRRAAALRPADPQPAESAETLWHEMGGTDEGWKALTRGETEGRLGVADGGDPPAWRTVEEKLPAFELTDLAGKTWRSADLAGQTLVVNLWATWCGPCRLELPYVQQIQERLADRPGVRVITLNADFNPGVIEPFLDRNGYRFPVLLATDFLNRQFRGGSLPQTWIVDATGVIRARQQGFSSKLAATWVDDALGQLDAVAGGRETDAP